MSSREIELQRFDELHSETQKLIQSVNKLKRLEFEVDDAEYRNLQVFNKQLKQGLSLVERRLEIEKKKLKDKRASKTKTDKMVFIKMQLDAIFADAIAKLYPSLAGISPVILSNKIDLNKIDMDEIEIGKLKMDKIGHFQFTSAVIFAPIFKKHGINKSERNIAKEIGSKVLAANDGPSPIIKKLEIDPTGLIDIFVSDRYVVDDGTFVTPFRSTVLGEFLARLLKFFGTSSLRHKPMSDWRPHIGMLISHLEEHLPDYLKKIPSNFELLDYYRDARKRFEEDATFARHAFNRVIFKQEGGISTIELNYSLSTTDYKKLYGQEPKSNVIQMQNYQIAQPK